MAHGSTLSETQIARTALVLWVVGALAMWLSLAGHRSANPVIFNRYSLSFGVVVGATGILVLVLGIFTRRVWSQPSRILERVWHFSPDILPLLSAILGIGSYVVLFLVLVRFGSFLQTNVFRIGLISVVVGGLLVLYAAALPKNKNAWSAVRMAVCTWACVLALALGGVLGALVLILPILDILAQAGKLAPLQLQPAKVLNRRIFSVGLLGLGCIFIGGWWYWTYAFSLSTTLFDDDLLHVAYASTHPLFSSLFQRDYLPALYYRPLYDVQAGVFYSLFGTNIAAWHLGQAFLLFISLALVFIVLRLVGLGRIPALLLALAFGSLPGVIIQLNWAIDVTTVLASLALLVLLLLHKPHDRPLWYASLGLILLVCPFFKEYGLAIVGGVMLYALEGIRSKQVPLRQGILILGITIAVTVIYLGLRLRIAGGVANTIQNDSGFLFRSYTFAELLQFDAPARLVFHTYTIAAQLVGDFFPVFTSNGVLDLSLLPLSATLFSALGIMLWAHTRSASKLVSDATKDETWRWRVLAAGLACAGVGFLLPQVVNFAHVNRNILASSVQTLLSIGIFLGIWFVLPTRSRDRLLALYALGLILVMSVLCFSFYQERHHYISGLGWVILLGLVLKHSDKTEWSRGLRLALLVLTVLLVFWNSTRAHEAIVTPRTQYAFGASSTLCKPFFPDPLARRLAAQWQVDLVALETCRTAATP